MRRGYAIIMIILGSIITADATMILELGIEDLVQRSEKIVQAEVSAIVTRWNKDSSLIETYVRLNIIDDLTGTEEGEEIIIVQPSGMIGELGLTVEGTADYEVGEEVLLFLNKDALNRTIYRTTGMYQGKYRVYTDQQLVQRVTRDTTSSASLVAIEGRSLDETPECGNGFTIAAFKNVIQEYLQKSGN